MENAYLFIFLLLFIHFKGFSQTWDWTHPEPNGIAVTQYSNTDALEDDEAIKVQTDASGNIYVLGDFHDSLYLNNNLITRGNGSYLAKYDSAGKLLWNKLFVPDTVYDPNYANSINATYFTVNAKGVFVTGEYKPSTGVYYDCNADTLISNPSRSYSIGSVNFATSPYDIGVFLTKFDANGNVVWNKTATSSSLCLNKTQTVDFLNSNPIITSDKNNNIISSFVLFSYQSSFSLGGDAIPLSGSDNINNRHLLAIKYNPNGVLQWSNYALDNTGQGDCNSIVTDNNGNIFLYGVCDDSTRFGSIIYHTSSGFTSSNYIAKLSSTGAWQFAKELCNGAYNRLQDGSSFSNPELLTVDNSNNVYALVHVENVNLPEIILGDTVCNSIDRTYLVKITNNGSLSWAKFFGFTTYGPEAFALHYSNNSLYLSGAIYGSYQFLPYVFSGLYVPPAAGGKLGYVAKTDLNGNFIWVTTFGSDNGTSYGSSVRTFNGNIYVCGNYNYNITTLGNLNESFTNPGFYNNLFFGKLKDQYIRVGAVIPTQIIPGCTLTIPFTSTGLTFSAGNTFTAELSNANGDFTNATAIGNVTSTGSGSIIATIPSTLTCASGYRVRIRSSDTLKTGYNYYAYADTIYKLTVTCSPPSSGFTVTNLTAASATLKWTTIGCAAGYKVQYRVKGTTAWTTVNITTNTDTVNITGLSANVIYQWRVATKCKNNGTTSFSPFSSIKQFTTAASLAVSGTITDADAESKASSITVYPNPATKRATVQVNSSKTTNYTLELTDISGRVLQTKTGSLSPGSNQIVIDVSKYAPGVYLINLIESEHKRTLKLNRE